jgi:glycosyltransferase involved in cell wall biosynthesis
MIVSRALRRVFNRALWSPVVLRVLRRVARVRARFPMSHGVTIVIVNWNSLNFLAPTLTAVQRLSPSGVRILVWDNGSSDGSAEYLRQRRDIRKVRAPSNLKHWRALDYSFLLARTEFVVALDVDAFPIRDDWLDVLLDPLRAGASISGAHVHRGYVHPCCLAMRWTEFVASGDSFRAVSPPGGFVLTGERHYDMSSGEFSDVGERMSQNRPGGLAFLEPTHTRGPGVLGTVFGDVVYHNFYAVRHLRENATEDMLIDGQVARAEALAAWNEAIAEYLSDLGPASA